MEESTWCPSCKAPTMHYDLVDCTSVCERCGCVQEESPLVSGEYGGGQRVDDDTGAAAAWRLLDSSRAGRLVRQEAFKLHSAGRPHAMRRVSDISDRVQLPAIYRTDVEALIDQVLQGEWGQGRWLDILVAACVYIVVRQRRLPLTVADVASAVQSNPVELGATYRRVLRLLEIQPPEADPMAFIRSAVSRLDALRGRQRAKLTPMLETAELLLKCAQGASLLTGRRPLPLAAAVLYQAAEAHQVKLTLDQVSLTLGAAASTAATRLRELRAALAAEGQKLPWGADITESSVKDHLPMILQLLRFSVDAAKPEQGVAGPGGSLEVRGGSRTVEGGSYCKQARGGALVLPMAGQLLSGSRVGARDSTVSMVTNGVACGNKPEVTGQTGAEVGNRSGSKQGKKRGRALIERPGTPEGMYVGPLGSYAQLKKVRNRSSEEAVNGECKEGDQEGFKQQGESPKVGQGSNVGAKGAGESTGGDERPRPEQSSDPYDTANGVLIYNERRDARITERRQYLNGVDKSIDTTERIASITPASETFREASQALKTVVGDTLELAAEREGVNRPGGIGTEDNQEAGQLVVNGRSELSTDSADVSIRPSGTEPGGSLNEASPSYEAWNGLPPSFRAQAIERKRRATLIADVKQRLVGIQAHLGVSFHEGGSLSAPALPPLPKLRPRTPDQVLLTAKRKRNAGLDPEWEARTVEALLLRGADERLLLEGQYEQARRQLEAARPWVVGEDDDVTEYIRTDAEVRMLQAAEDFVARESKRPR